MIKAQIEGVNSSPQRSEKAYDMRCPMMGSGRFNYYKEECERRQKDPIHERTCYPYCKANSRLSAEMKEQAKKAVRMNIANFNRHARAKARYDEVNRLHREGLTYYQIMDKLGISRSVVTRARGLRDK